MNENEWRTKRCIIKPFTEKDKTEAKRIFTDDDVRRYLGGALSDAQADERLNAYFMQSKTLYATVRLFATGTFLGLLELSPAHDRIQTELSYYFLPEFWSQGYAGEVITAMLLICKEHMTIDHVVCETQTANISSCRMLEKLGFQKVEELLRFQTKQTVYEYRWKS